MELTKETVAQLAQLSQNNNLSDDAMLTELMRKYSEPVVFRFEDTETRVSMMTLQAYPVHLAALAKHAQEQLDRTLSNSMWSFPLTGQFIYNNRRIAPPLPRVQEEGAPSAVASIPDPVPSTP